MRIGGGIRGESGTHPEFFNFRIRGASVRSRLESACKGDAYKGNLPSLFQCFLAGEGCGIKSREDV